MKKRDANSKVRTADRGMTQSVGEVLLRKPDQVFEKAHEVVLKVREGDLNISNNTNVTPSSINTISLAAVALGYKQVRDLPTEEELKPRTLTVVDFINGYWEKQPEMIEKSRAVA